jgi:TolA-binding protein
MQIPRYEAALEPLDRMLREHPDHAVHRDARLARGITLRNLGRLDDARIDLDAFLETSPEGHALGHALYELALIDQQQKQPQRAADKLKRLVDQVPDYPDLENVLYELGWSHRESGDDDAAVAEFTELIRRFGDSPLAAEAAYFVGQQAYASQDWSQAAEQFRIAAERSDDADLSEKAFYRLGWALYKLKQYEPARAAFAQQAERHPDGNLILDALLMTAECDFRSGQFQPALESYQAARERIRQTDDNADSIRDRADRQIRELVLLHGGQSAGQMKQWKQAIGWFDELRQRFPATTYLPQAFYETGFAYQQLDQPDKAIDFFAQVANKYRSETAARARFMIGEIHFAEKRYDLAIPEFQRVMFGFGAEKAAENVKNWQAKSGYEAGRCSELLIQKASSQAGREKASRLAREFFSYVVDKHPDHELAAKSRERLEALKSK